MTRRFAFTAAPILAALALATLGASAAQADERFGPLLPAYRDECGSCHVAFPPALLPAASWQRLMAGLDRHFGVDASLDDATRSAITAWLAGARHSRESAPPPEDRITRSRWFVREHDEVAASVWQRPAVGRPSNCAACHAGADKGVFDEHAIRIPR